MIRVVVPVRYPLSEHSQQTLDHAIEIAESYDASLTVLHVSLYQSGRRVTRRDLRRAVEAVFGRLPYARYVVRIGFLVEETILEEVVAEDADIVVIGSKQAGRWRRTLRQLMGDPDIETFLREQLDCQVITVQAD